MKKKHIILICLAIALVAFCVYWFGMRKKNDGGGEAKPSGGDDGDDDANSLIRLDYKGIINSLDLEQETKTALRSMADYIRSEKSWYDSVKEKASKNGRTNDQQLVLDAAYVLYEQKNEISAGEYSVIVSKLN